jgi:hypothetical protein
MAATAKFPKEAGGTRHGENEESADRWHSWSLRAAKWMMGSALRMDGGEFRSI